MSSPDAPAPSVVRVSDLEALARAAAKHVRAAAARALTRRGRFRLALAGGSTPRALYRELAARGGIDWQRTDVFFGDERGVPPDNDASNYRMAFLTLLGPASVPEANVRRMRGEAPDLMGAAREYEQALRVKAAPPWLDLVLMGLGNDGHTASLFPANPALDDLESLCVAVDLDPDEEPAGAAVARERLTLGYATLLGAEEVAFLVSGNEKARALRDVLVGPDRPRGLPAQVVMRRPRGGVTVFCDAGAAALLPEDLP